MGIVRRRNKITSLNAPKSSDVGAFKNTHMTPLIITIYLVGCIAAYLITRRIVTEGDMECWTVGDRIAIMALSVLSWIVAGISLVILFFAALESDKPAKW